MVEIGVVDFGKTVQLTASTSSVGATIDMAGANALYVVNTGSSGWICFRYGQGPQTAVLTTDTPLPALRQLVVSVPPTTTHVAAIANTGTAVVYFTPCRVAD
jgi:hypothetical protein